MVLGFNYYICNVEANYDKLGFWANALHGGMRLTILNFMCIDIDSLSECHQN